MSEDHSLAIELERLRAELRWENRKFAVQFAIQLVLAFVAAVAAGGALTTLFLHLVGKL